MEAGDGADVPSSSGAHDQGHPSLPFDTQDRVTLDAGCGDFQLLKRALLNERMAPEILAYKEDLVQRVKEGLEHKDAELLEMEGRKEYDLVHAALCHERDRVRYLLKAYLRTRLQKIQAFAGSVLASPALIARVSPAELEWAQDYFMALGCLYRDSALEALPRGFQHVAKCHADDADNLLLDQPDLTRYVFCHVLQDCGQVPDGPDGNTAEMKQGDQLVVRYATVARLLHAGQVALL